MKAVGKMNYQLSILRQWGNYRRVPLGRECRWLGVVGHIARAKDKESNICTHCQELMNTTGHTTSPL
jgi:hypothetical protein